MNSGDSGKSDGVLSGSLASLKPPTGGKPEEHGDEETETHSRSHFQGSDGFGRTQRRQEAGGVSRAFDAAKKRAAPYTKIVEELSDMRRDTVELANKAVGENRRAYVLVNNRSEGNAPLAVQALVDRV